MKKIIIIIISIIIFIGFIFIYNFKNIFSIIENNKEEKIIINSKIDTKNIVKPVIEKKQTEKQIKELSKNKLEELRKRYSNKGLIMSGDMHMSNDEYLLALQNYLEVLRKTPKDSKIIQKIGDTYYNMKKFDKAYLYYSKIKKYSSLDTNKAILSLLYSKELSKENIDYLYKEIDSFNIGEEYNFYYKNTLSCLDSFHECKLKFNEYFDKNKVAINELKNIKNAIQKYRDFQIQELYYKNTLIVGAIFENGLYSISVKLGKDILSGKIAYKPLLKIIAKSYYELGQYNFAKKYLSDYYTQAPEDKNAIYMIGVVKMKLKDYLISNIFFNKLLKTDYENILDLRKNMIYNYYKLGETTKMLSMFKLLAKEDKVSKGDISLIIYYHIINQKIEYAQNLTTKYIEKYPEDDIFYSYLGWIYKDKGDILNAEINLKKAISLYQNNTMASFNLGLVEKLRGNNLLAKLYFKKTIKIDEKGEYGILAKKELDKLNTNLSN